MKKTLFYDDHVELGGKMVDFSGFSLPIQYSSIIDEHEKVRTKAGLFDVSHMGEFIVTGEETEKFIQHLITNDLLNIPCGAGVLYTPMCRENGTIVDDLLVYRLEEKKALLVVNAANAEKDFNWCKQVSEKFNVVLTNESEAWSQLAIQGPNAEKILNPLTEANLAELKGFNFIFTKVFGIDCLVSRTGYTGEDGFEIYIKGDSCRGMYKKLIDAKKNEGIVPTGLGARDTLRFESKLMLYGNDIDDTTTPIEAGLSWTVKFDKGDFLGRDILLKQKEEKPSRRLVGIKMIDKGIPRHGFKLFNLDNEEIGYVTSGTKSPTLGDFLALGYVKRKYTNKGTEILVQIRNKNKKGEIIKTPFYKR